MSWIQAGAFHLAKIGQKIINQSWHNWWPEEENEIILRQIEPKEYHYPQKENKYDRHYPLPVLVSPHQDRTWVKSLKELISVR